MKGSTKPGIFLDLDGITFDLVCHFGEFGVSARTLEEVRVVKGLTAPLDKLKGLGFEIVGVTNQPDLAREKITPEFLSEKHRILLEAYPQISEVFVCPHTETDGCRCRKPKPGLLVNAANKHQIDRATSWMIGDSRGDMEAGLAAHCKLVLVQTAWNSRSTAPVLEYVDYVAGSTRGALEIVLHAVQGTKNLHDA